MNTEQRIRWQIGDLVIQLMSALAENDQLKEKIKELEKPKEDSDVGHG